MEGLRLSTKVGSSINSIQPYNSAIPVAEPTFSAIAKETTMFVRFPNLLSRWFNWTWGCCFNWTVLDYRKLVAESEKSLLEPIWRRDASLSCLTASHSQKSRPARMHYLDNAPCKASELNKCDTLEMFGATRKGRHFDCALSRHPASRHLISWLAPITSHFCDGIRLPDSPGDAKPASCFLSGCWTDVSAPKAFIQSPALRCILLASRQLMHSFCYCSWKRVKQSSEVIFGERPSTCHHRNESFLQWGGLKRHVFGVHKRKLSNFKQRD